MAKVESKGKVEEVEVKAVEKQPRVEEQHVTVHLDRDPNDPRIVRDVPELKSLDD